MRATLAISVLLVGCGQSPAPEPVGRGHHAECVPNGAPWEDCGAPFVCCEMAVAHRCRTQAECAVATEIREGLAAEAPEAPEADVTEAPTPEDSVPASAPADPASDLQDSCGDDGPCEDGRVCRVLGGTGTFGCVPDMAMPPEDDGASDRRRTDQPPARPSGRREGAACDPLGEDSPCAQGLLCCSRGMGGSVCTRPVSGQCPRLP